MTTLARRLREAADTLEELAQQANYPQPVWAAWTPIALRREADVLEAPDGV